MNSTKKTLRHMKRVQDLLSDAAMELLRRGQAHDLSKLTPAEMGPLAEMDALIEREGQAPFGSEEYERRRAMLGPMLEHHYANNSHHPEHYEDGVAGTAQAERHGPVYPVVGRAICPPDNLPTGKFTLFRKWFTYLPRHGKMTGMEVDKSLISALDLFDVLEMFVDWKAASERGEESAMGLEAAFNRFSIPEPLAGIIRNTADRLGWAR